jgi:hypothetical protein
MEFKYTKLYDGIYVYHDTFKDFPDWLDVVSNFEAQDNKMYSILEWRDWYTFGKMRAFIDTRNIILDADVTQKYVAHALNVYDQTTKHYIADNNIDDSNLYPNHGFLCYYDPEKQNKKDLRENYLFMTYHTDYQQEKEDEPGQKFELTCNMYINDDYEGGEIAFSVGQDRFEYKPKAGDVIIFPSKDPYYHGVKPNFINKKYFIRSFLMYNKLEDQEWIDGINKYGEALWLEMRKQIREDIILSTKPIKHMDYQKPNYSIDKS